MIPRDVFETMHNHEQAFKVWKNESKVLAQRSESKAYQMTQNTGKTTKLALKNETMTFKVREKITKGQTNCAFLSLFSFFLKHTGALWIPGFRSTPVPTSNRPLSNQPWHPHSPTALCSFNIWKKEETKSPGTAC